MRPLYQPRWTDTGLRAGRRSLRLLAMALFAAACGDADSTAQPTSLDPGDRLADVLPGQVSDLSARTLNHRAVELTWTEVDDGKGAPAQYQVRLLDAAGGWDEAAVVREGACAYPVRGANVGSTVRCVVTGLAARQGYRFLVGAERADITGTVRSAPSSSVFATTRAEPVVEIPAHAEIVSGLSHTGTVGQALQTEIRVLLQDSAGLPLPDAYVVWASGAGGGSTAAPISVSDDYGVARTVWTLGPEAGPQSLSVRVEGQPEMVISADAAAGPVETLRFVVDTVRLAIGEEERLAVQGWDEYGNLVQDLPLEWQSSNGSVADVDSRGVVRVNGRGWVWIRAWVNDRWRKTKSVDSTTVVVEADPASIADLAIDGVGEDWITLTFTEVDDGTGQPARYETRLGSPGTGWGDALEISEGSCASPLEGTAIGADRVCTVTGLADATTYVAQVRPYREKQGERVYAKAVASVTQATLEAPAVPSGVAAESGSHQVGMVGAPLPSPVVVRVSDAEGGPVPGVPVSFSASDGGSVSQATVVTDEGGRASVSWTLGARVGTQALTTVVGSSSGAAGAVSGSSNATLPPTSIPATANAGPAASITVSPANLSLAAGATGSFTAQALDAYGNVTSGAGLAWSSDDPSVVTVSEVGGVTAVGGGQTVVRAVLGEVVGTAPVSVQQEEQPTTPDPSRIDDLRVVTVTPRSVELEFTEVDDGTGAAARSEIRYAFSPMGWGWASATVVASGTCASPMIGGTVGSKRRCVVDGLEEGTSYDFQMVAWRVEGGTSVYSELSNVVTGTTDAGSTPPPPTVTSVAVSPTQISFDQAGQTRQLSATAYDGNGSPVSTPIDWSSSNPAVATVSATGVVTAQGSGSATIVAAALCCAQSASASVTVTIQAPPPPPPPPPPPSGGLFASQDWAYADRAAMLAQPDLDNGGTAGGQGGSTSRPAVLSQPGPWGGTTVLENYYGVIPATAQPQVGTHWYLPDGAREIWVDTWVRFAPEWSIYPDNPNYPGNVDHKLIFIWEGDGGPWPNRWECKVGPWFTTMPCSANSHDTYYQYMKNPASNIYSPQTRLDANTAAWDGQWHHLRMHLKMGTTDGRMRVWWDNQLTIDSGLIDTKSGNRWFDAITFGGNRNQGTDHPMSFYFGPAQVYTSDPGW